MRTQQTFIDDPTTSAVWTLLPFAARAQFSLPERMPPARRAESGLTVVQRSGRNGTVNAATCVGPDVGPHAARPRLGNRRSQLPICIPNQSFQWFLKFEGPRCGE